ncbi:MAG: M23 family metallopeptidase [Weeksellaceae bacterium]
MTKKKKNIAKSLIHHYRWLIVDEDTKESKVSFRLNILNFLLLIAFLSLFIFGISFLFLKYSPFKDYFIDDTAQRGNNLAEKQELLELNEKLLSLEDSLQVNELYLTAISDVISGKVEVAKVDSLVAKQSPVLLNDKKLYATPEDSIFRMKIAEEELADLKQNSNVDSFLLFPPVRGIVTASYDITINHLATDIAASKGDDIKSIADGKVIFTDWTPDSGNIIIVLHRDDMISIYKHCLQVFKKAGDEVSKGDLIASIGNGGELTTGPHLHFELWIQGNAVNAEDYIDF